MKIYLIFKEERKKIYN